MQKRMMQNSAEVKKRKGYCFFKFPAPFHSLPSHVKLWAKDDGDKKEEEGR